MFLNSRNLEHAVNLLRYSGDKAKQAEIQAKFNAQRLARFERAIFSRPIYIPLQFKLSAAGEISPYDKPTPAQPFPVVITGIMSDSPAREIVLQESVKDIPFVHNGEDRTLKLTLGEISGRPITATEKAQIGTFELPAPLLIESNDRLTVNLYKTETTDAGETVNVVLIGYRVFPNSEINGEQRTLIEKSLAARRTSRFTTLKQKITFDADTAAGKTNTIYTPQSDEPLLIRGVRTSLKYASIDLSIEGESDMTIAPCPIWAVAGNDDNAQENYLYLQRPLFLPARATLAMKLISSTDGGTYDAAGGNYITWLCETI